MHGGSHRVRVCHKVWLDAGGKFAVGDGGMALLRAIDAEGSIRAAAITVGWSYRHALMYLDNAEAALQQHLIERARGGSEQGGARLTSRGRALVQRYTRFRREMDKALQRLSRSVVHETGG